MSKMVKCKACGKEIAKGTKCVGCGKDQRNFFMKHKVLTVILTLIILGGIGSAMGGDEEVATTAAKTTTTDTAKAKTTTEKPAEKPVEKKVEVAKPVALPKITSIALIKAYTANEVRADQTYKNKEYEITGQVYSVAVVFGSTVVALSDGSDFSLTNVSCTIDKEDVAKVAKIDKGDTVTITGKITGQSIDIGVDDCLLK